MKFHNILSSKLPHINVFYIIIILNFIKICFLCIFKAWARVRCTFFIFDRYMVLLHNFCFCIHKMRVCLGHGNAAPVRAT